MTRLSMVSIVLASALCGCATTPSNRPAPAPDKDWLLCEPYLLSSAPLHYPPELLRSRTEGWVVLGFELDGSGIPINVREIDSEPQGVFVQAAIDAMPTARYKTGVTLKGCARTFQFTLVNEP